MKPYNTNEHTIDYQVAKHLACESFLLQKRIDFISCALSILVGKNLSATILQDSINTCRQQMIDMDPEEFSMLVKEKIEAASIDVAILNTL